MKRALLILGLVAPLAARADVTSTGPLQMRARGDLVLGVDTQAIISLDGSATRVVTNVGTIALGPDGLHAVLTLPAERYPQVAIVAALDMRDVVIDWLAIPLAGQARVKVETASHASVVVRVGERDAPAAQADGRGITVVSIVVPPGVAVAQAFATAKNGSVTEKQLPLGVKPFVRTLAVCSAPAAVLAVDARGIPATDAPVIDGGASAARVLRPGWFEVDVPGEVDEVALSAAFAGEPASTCRVIVPRQGPTKLTLSANRTTHIAGDAAIELRATLEYLGQRRHVAALAFETDTGTIEASGETARWTLPANAANTTARARVVATWPGGSLEQSIDVALVVAPVAVVVKPVEPLPRFGINARTGVVANLGRMTAPMIAAGGDVRLRNRFTLGLEVGAYRSTFDATVMDETISNTLAAVPLVARFAVRVRRGAIDFSSGVGAGVMFVSTRLDSRTTGTFTESAVRPMATAFAGGAYRFDWGMLGVEISYAHATLDGALHGRIGGVGAAIGYRIER